MSSPLAARTPPAPGPAAAGTAGLLRSSRVMALGTLASRGSGFLRVVVLAAALGVGIPADAYNVANVLPNILYELLLGGILTSVVVPLLVSAAATDSDGGEAYAQRLLTVVAVVLGAVALLAVLCAPVLAGLYPRFTGPQRDLLVTFTRFFLPQIVFYGVGATIGAVLNARGSFAAPMWAPVLNNVVVLATAAVFLTLPRAGAGELLTPGQTLTLAIGTTGGIAAQTLALLPALRRTGFRWRPRLDLRGSGLGAAVALGGWVIVYVLANQIGFNVVVNLATAASKAAGGEGIGYSAYLNAFTVFSLPHAVVAVSVITALLPRMSRHAAGADLAGVRESLGTGLRIAGVVLVPAALALVALGPLVGVVLFGHGSVSVAEGARIGAILAGFAVGLVPFSAFQLSLRAFYALKDTRTPALVNLAVNAVNIAVDLVLYAVLPPQDRVVGLALGYAASYAAGLAITGRLLRRRLPAGRPQHVVRTYVRLLLAGAPPALVALLAGRGLYATAGPGTAAAALGLAVALPVLAAGFLLVAGRLRVPEVAGLVGTVAGLLPRRRGPAG